MNISYKEILILAFGGLMLLVLIVSLAFRRRNPPPEVPPEKTKLSALAGWSFFFGLATIVLLIAAAITAQCAALVDVLRISPGEREALRVAARIVLFSSLAPALAALTFALAARGSILESREGLRGRTLYRTSVMLALIGGVFVLDGSLAVPDFWTRAHAWAPGAPSTPPPFVEPGYIGIEVESAGDRSGNQYPGSVRVKHVAAGSPAATAGLKAGDVILSLDQMYLPPEPFGDVIRKRGAGGSVRLNVMRADKQYDRYLTFTIGLIRDPIVDLVGLLARQSLDAERMSILQGATAGRMLKADELRRIGATFDTDAGRLGALQHGLPLVTDPENSYQVLGVLETADAKKTASEWIQERAKKGP